MTNTPDREDTDLHVVDVGAGREEEVWKTESLLRRLQTITSTGALDEQQRLFRDADEEIAETCMSVAAVP